MHSTPLGIKHLQPFFRTLQVEVKLVAIKSQIFFANTLFKQIRLLHTKNFLKNVKLKFHYSFVSEILTLLSDVFYLTTRIKFLFVKIS